MAAVTQVRILVTAYFEPHQVCEEQPFLVSAALSAFGESLSLTATSKMIMVRTEEGDIAQW